MKGNKSNEYIEKLLDMCLNEVISKEEYVKKKNTLEEELILYQNAIDELNAEQEDSESKTEKKIKALKEKLNKGLDFSSNSIPEGIIKSLVDKITVYQDRFEWELNIFDDRAIIAAGIDGDIVKSSIISDNILSYRKLSTGSYR